MNSSDHDEADRPFPRGLDKDLMKNFTALAAIALSGAALFAPASLQNKDIVDVAAGNKNFTTLVKLVKAAGLVDTLKGPGPFTVLAPTNAAFAKVPKSLLTKLMNDKALLTKVLTYHVIPGNIMAKDLKTMSAPTAQGESIAVMIRGRNVMFNKARPVMTDVKASNGVIHAIDSVLLPPSVAKMVAKK